MSIERSEKCKKRLFLFLTDIKIHFSSRFKNTKVHPKVHSKVTTKKV